MIRRNAQALAGRKVLVTGGTGFIGGRLVERLCIGSGAGAVRVLLRRYSRASRIARFPVEMVRGDLTDAAEVARAVEGCDVVLHCAADASSGNTKEGRRRVNVDGTRHVLEAAERAGVDRVVHLSSLAVYGTTPDGDLDETAPRRYTDTSYADTKLDSEKLALRFARERGLPVAVLQPTAVYGPFGGVWTEAVLEQMSTGRVILVDGGAGLCNAVYIDDLVRAILLAATREEAVGSAFLISGPEHVTWREFYGAFERMLGVAATVSMSAADARDFWERVRPRKPGGLVGELLRIVREDRATRRRLLRSRELRLLKRGMRALLPAGMHERLVAQAARKARAAADAGAAEPAPAAGGDPEGDRDPGSGPIHPLTPHQIEFFSTKTRVCIDRARARLGYEPAYDLESGMRLTREWAEWAGRVEPEARSRPVTLAS